MSKFSLSQPSLYVCLGLLAVSVAAQQTTTPPKTAPHHSTSTTAHRSTTTASQPFPAPVVPKTIPAVTAQLKYEFALRYQDITIGTGALAASGQSYKVHYTGWLEDGTKFDSSLDRGQPIEFQQGLHRVITGWDEGFEGMRVGGKRRLFIPWQLAYGEQGRGQIPPKANLIFDVELVDQHDLNSPTSAPH
jgi:peptidylprolyl isomerase